MHCRMFHFEVGNLTEVSREGKAARSMEKKKNADGTRGTLGIDRTQIQQNTEKKF